MELQNRWRSIGWACTGWVAFTLSTSLGCSTGSFLCSSDLDCGNGSCESNGYCSFPDDSCASGQRYGEHAGGVLAGACVGAPGSSSSSSSSATIEPDPGSTSLPPATTTLDPDGGSVSSSSSTGPVSESTGPAPGTTTDTGPAESSGEPLQRVSDGLLAFYPLDEGRGTVVEDQSGFGSPLNLTVEGMVYAWTSDGIMLEDAILRGAVPPTKILDGCQATNEFTAEAWVTPMAAIMEGPGRIITLSESSSFRNFTLGQGQYLEPASPYIGRVRTSDLTGDDNGTPQISTPEIAMPVLTHLAYVRTTEGGGHDRLYVDGLLEAEGVRTGDFSMWSSDAEFACGNEVTTSRPWQGVLHLVAIYDHALTEEEIAQNIAVGF